MALKCNLPIHRWGGTYREIEVSGRGTFFTFVLLVQQKINKLRKQRPSRCGTHQYSRSILRKRRAFELRSRRIQPFSWSSRSPAPKTKGTPLFFFYLLSPPFWLHVYSAPKKRERRRRRRIFPWMSRRGGGEKEGGGLFTSAWGGGGGGGVISHRNMPPINPVLDSTNENLQH